MSEHLLKGDDPILRADALDALLDQLLGSDDRTLAVEDLAVPGRASDGEPGGADARAAVVGTAVNAAQSPPFMTAKRVVVLHQGPLHDLLAYASVGNAETARRSTNLFADPTPVDVGSGPHVKRAFAFFART